MFCYVYIFSDSKCKYLALLKLEIKATSQHILSWMVSREMLAYCVAVGKRCDPEWVALFLGSDL
jgi:hypothetical protein